MERFQKTFENLRKQTDPRMQPLLGPLERYLACGDPAALKLIVSSRQHTWFLGHFASVLAAPPEVGEEDRRLLTLLVACDRLGDLSAWLPRSFTSGPGDQSFAAAVTELRAAGMTEGQLDSLALICAPAACDVVGRVTPIGNYLLEMDAARLSRALNEARTVRHSLHVHLHGLLRLFLDRAPQWVDLLLSIARLSYGEESLCLMLLQWFGERFEPMAADCFFRHANAFELGMKLAEFHADRYAAELTRRLPAHLASKGVWDAGRVLPCLGSQAVGAFVEHLTRGADDAVYVDAAKFALEHIAGCGGDPAKEGLLAVLEKAASPAVRAAALEHLVVLDEPALAQRLESAIETGMTADARDAARFAVLAAKFAGGRLRERLWQELASKSKLRRDALAEAIAGGDEQALDRAAALLSDKSKEARWGAVSVLGRLKTAQAVDCLLHWLPREQSEEVRDEIARALRGAGVPPEAIVRGLGPLDLEKLHRQADAIGGMPVKWLSATELPPIPGVDGRPLDAPLVRYLLYRQSRQKEPIVDPEAAPVYALIDRRTSGDFAHALLGAFLEADAPKADAWALITAGLLGDHRLITTLATKVRAWAQEFAQKLGEWGIEALALNGSDAALASVDSIATKFKDNPRRKFKVIADAAAGAMELAAKRLGLTAEEIAERVVPTLGFEPGRPRRVQAGNRVIEATIGLDFKLSLKDAASGKAARSIPKAAGPEVVSEFKGLGKLLAELAKSQALRLEQLMIGRRRWAAARWQALFLEHPVLFPFAVRLVWGVYDQSGTVGMTIRALPDRSLTDCLDEPAEVAAREAAVGIVHPLDLSADQIAAWRSHLADYEIEPPFPQIDRPVVRVSPEERELKGCERMKGTTLNAMSFRSKAERSGWSRGPVGDGAMVGSYRRRFALLDIDAFITLEGLPVYADPAAQVTLGTLLFAPADTTPRDFHSRLILLGEVPAMAFCEAVGDMLRISGRLEAASLE